MMRSMLKGAALPKNLWAEAIRAACYMKNRSPSSSKSTTHELWFGTRPDMSRLFTTFLYVPKEKRKPLDDRSEKCILIAYGSGNDYRLLTTRHLPIAREVKFDEALVGLRDLRNEDEQLYIFDDKEKKDAQTPVEGFKDPVGQKPALKEAERSATCAEKISSVARSRQEGRKVKNESKEDDSVLTDLETYSDSESPEESRVVSQGILNSIGGLLSRLSGAAANIIESTSSMAPEEMVYRGFLETDPTGFQGAISGPESKESIGAIQSEVSSLQENKTWEQFCLPPGRRKISKKWVLKKKINAEGKFCRCEERLVCKGFMQRKCVDVLETFEPLSQFQSIRCLTAIAAHYGLKQEQIDVVTGFINADVEEKIYIQVSQGLEVPEELKKASPFLHVLKALGGLKQAPRL